MKKVLVLFSLILGIYNNSHSQTFLQLVKAVVSDREANAHFGISVSMSGNYAVVGAFVEDKDANGGNALNDAGAAYIFKKDQNGSDKWGLVKKIVASDRAANDYFGSSVSISGDYIIVGSYGDDEDASGGNTKSLAGSAYIFKKDAGGIDSWGQIKKIVASDRSANDYFGRKVATSGDYLIVGAYLDTEDASGGNSKPLAGSAYIFKKDVGGIDNWGQIKKIVASDRGADDLFGYSVSISGDYAMVGAFQEDEDAAGINTKINSGSVYIYKRDQGGTDNWGQIKKLVLADRAANDYFGYTVNISGDYAIISAYGEDEDATGANTITDAGGAYIFKKDQGGIDNWGLVKKIVASDRGVSDEFGISTSISDDYAVVGADFEDEDAAGTNTLNAAGSAYIFKKDQGGIDNWGQVQKIVASDRATNDNLGISVANSGDYIIVGTDLEDEDASGTNTLSAAGSTYILKNSPVLSTELINISCQVFLEGNLIKWQMANDVIFNGFRIERKSNSNWEELTFIQSKNKTTHYQFIDEFPYNISYYRLIQIDIEGKEIFSKVISVQRDNKSKIKISPSVVESELRVKYEDFNKSMDVQIVNIMGQVVYQQAHTFSNGDVVVNVSSLQSGTYFLRVDDNTVKLIKK